MTGLDRDAFLRRVGGALAATSAFFYPGIDKAVAGIARPSKHDLSTLPAGRTVLTLNGPDPTYAAGLVTSIDGDHFVLESATATKDILITSDDVVWKEFDLDRSAIAIGDWIDAKVVPQPDGSLAAQSGWIFANIGKRSGTFRGFDGKNVTIEGAADGATHVFSLSPRLIVERLDESPIPGGIASFKDGQYIGAVGLVLPGGGFRATKVWTA